MKHLVALFCVVVLTNIAVFVIAGQEKKKDGHDAYWQNRLSFATDDAIINQPLVPQFLNAPESFPIDETTGDVIPGSTRRAYSSDHNVGRLFTIDVVPFSMFGEQQSESVPVIHVQLVFDLREDK